ncbi:hypothetical protein [Spirosoma fluminis]
MKGILSTLLSLILLAANAQNKVEGLGPFKIGQTTITIIDDLAKEMRTKIQIIDSRNRFKAASGKLYEIVNNPKNPDESPSDAKLCSKARVFMVGSYKVADIKLEHIILTFLNDKLIYLRCDGSNTLDDAFDVKYGKSKLEAEQKPSANCGGLEKTYTRKWGNEDISATSYFASSRSYNCSEFLYYSFSIGSEDWLFELRMCNEEAEEKNRAEKKKKLNDL